MSVFFLQATEKPTLENYDKSQDVIFPNELQVKIQPIYVKVLPYFKSVFQMNICNQLKIIQNDMYKFGRSSAWNDIGNHQ